METAVSYLHDLVLMPTFWQWLGMIVIVIFIVGSVRNLFRIKKCWWSYGLLAVMGFLAGGTVVYIGDLANLPPTFLALLLNYMGLLLRQRMEEDLHGTAFRQYSVCMERHYR